MQLHSLTVVIVLAAAVTGVTVAVGSTTAAGQQTEADAVLEDVLEGPAANESTSDWIGSGLDKGASAFEGWRQRQAHKLLQLPAGALEVIGVAGDGPTSSATASEVQETWNANDETLDAYGSARKNWTENKTVEVTWKIEGETATRYLLANASNGSVATQMVANTSRTPTDDVALCGYAAGQSPAELEYFIEEYAAANESAPWSYLVQLRAQYGPDVETTLYPTSGECDVGNATATEVIRIAG